MSALYIGFLVGLFRLILDTIVTFNPDYVFSGFLKSVVAIPFSHFAIVIFILSTGILFLVSFATPRPDMNQIKGLAYGTLTPEMKLESKRSFSKTDVLASVFIVVIIVCIMVYFTGD